ncbi:histidine kinase [Lentzea sp. NBC_00516]|uniref:sensor histidine kinase n=1 Tax=Lentzea sp. NBC_00516 TaxID=2903582 RepID=UPI002E81122A|nr:histidine kinase [Lentzea sp. NBC_00516]WUD21427.1 histidine kinase [Lentzea sp. NBC_00516]
MTRAGELALALLVAALGIGREFALPAPSHLVAAGTTFYVTVHLLAAAALWWRRTHPVASGSAIAFLTLLTPTFASVVSVYSITAHTTRHRWLVPVHALAWLAGSAMWTFPDGLVGPCLIAIAGLTGLHLGERRRFVEALAERERELMAEHARADERTRLAAEMHDVVTHRLNLMVLHAGALRMAAKDDDVRKAAEELRAAGCHSLAELRDLVGVLRAGRAARIPDVLPDRLSRLVADSAATGLEITLTEHGDADTISPAVRRTMYRVVQESLTNVHKHAPGAHTEITIHCGPSSVRAVIRNTRPSAVPALVLPGSGSGLLGLRGRVEMVGGTLTAGPTDDGGFEVDAVLPAFVPT